MLSSNIFTSNIIAAAEPSLLDYFWQSNFAGQVIIVFLFALSLLAWGVMFCKYSDLSAMEEANKQASQRAAKSPSIIEAAAAVKSIACPYSSLLREALNTLGYMGDSKRASSSRTAMVENALSRALSTQTAKYEEKMTLLGTIISGAPFLGLLGTAWGVMDCFGSMSGQSSVTLQQLAPGVSGALLTTVSGLVVAIPSVFGYNYLSTKIKRITIETENFAGVLSDRIEMEAMASEPVAARASKPSVVVPPAAPVPAPVPEAAKVLDFSLDDEASEEISNFDEE